jgi:ABC-type nitrate/sulfonate/bicarbonate transport system substrate-binding protein
MQRRTLWTGAIIATLAVASLAWIVTRGRNSEAPAADGLPTLAITVFAAPSQSIWFPTIIQKTGLDVKNGFHLEVKQKPGQTAYAEFASGVDKVCYCAAPAAVARFVQQGADISLLWNVFSAEYVLITNNPAVKTAADIAGRKIAADTSTGGYAVAAMLLDRNGVDLKTVDVQSAWGTAQAALLATHRVDALLQTPVEASLLQASDPASYRIIGLIDASGWRKSGYGPGVPAIAFGVWRDWLAVPANADLARRFYRANVEAVAFAKANPERAADIVSGAVDVKRASVLNTLKLRSDYIRVAPISEYRAPIALLTGTLLPKAGLLDRPLTEAELSVFVSDFKP